MMGRRLVAPPPSWTPPAPLAPSDLPGDAALAEFLGNAGSKRKRSTGLRDSAFATRGAEVRAMMVDGRWERALPVHYVAMYARLHEGVYGVAPGELGPTERVRACRLAKRMLEREFNQQCGEMALYIRWVWQREQSREKWRRQNQQPGRRITWMVMFGGALLTDYRVELARAQSR